MGLSLIRRWIIEEFCATTGVSCGKIDLLECETRIRTRIRILCLKTPLGWQNSSGDVAAFWTKTSGLLPELAPLVADQKKIF